MSTQSSSRRNSILIAAAVAVGLSAWIASGLGSNAPDEQEAASTNSTAAIRVTTRHSLARTMQRTITASARTEPNRALELKAETQGRIARIGADRGARIAAGGLVAEIGMAARNEALEEARALVRQRELEFEAAERLREQGFMSAAELAATEAMLATARAQQRRIEIDIAYTRIVAPFDAVIFDRHVEIGDYVGIGDPIVDLVDTDPLIVVGNINEKDIADLAVGDSGAARVLGGPETQGTIRYIAPVADEATRSFRTELAIPNPDGKLRVGASAELIMGAEEITAHQFSAALLSLADDGTVGVMTVDEQDRARFLPIELSGSLENGILATGLPHEIRVITVGQGFVTDGQRVIPVEESAEAASTD